MVCCLSRQKIQQTLLLFSNYELMCHVKITLDVAQIRAKIYLLGLLRRGRWFELGGPLEIASKSQVEEAGQGK